MTATQVLDQLREHGVRLSLQGTQLRYEAPKGVMTESLLTLMREHRDAIAQRLAAEQHATQTRPTKRFGFVAQRPTHSPLFDSELVADHPYHRLVEPYKGQLLRRLRLDKRYLHGAGCWLTDAQGHDVFDALAQYGALPFGHHPVQVWDAISVVREQGEPAFNANAVSDSAGELAERLIGLWPEAGFEGVSFCNSGAEALEMAVKLCRAATGRHAMLAAAGGFHGLTLGALPLTGTALFREGFAQEDGTVHVPYGDAQALAHALQERPGAFAGVVLEPIQGESGVVEPPSGYLAEARRLCDRHGALLVLDEVQTGLGRTGMMFASQYENVVPDVMPLAKSLGGGLIPIGACLYRASARSERFGLRHGSTFAAGTIACRAALATLDRLQADDGALLRHVRERGAQLRGRLEALRERHPQLVNGIRGRGFMQGIALDFGPLRREAGLLGPMHDQNILIHLLVSHLLHAGRVRIAPSLSVGNVLRLLPPLIASENDLEHVAQALEGTLDALACRDTYALAAHLLENPAPRRTPRTLPAEPRRPDFSPRPQQPSEGRFAFAVHPLSFHDLERLDPSLAGASADDARRLFSQFADFVDPQPIEALEIVGIGGARAYGELILIPYTPQDLMRMTAAKAIEEVELAVRVAQERGAQVVGLGGFTSIVTQGGLGLLGKGLPALTSGNSFTATATREALLAGCASRGTDPARAGAAIVGAGGMVGRAVSLLLAQDFARLILVGNPTSPTWNRARAEALCADLAGQLNAHAALLSPHPGSVAERIAGGGASAAQLLAEGRLVIGGTLDEALPAAHAVALATNSIETFVKSRHLAAGAVVCDTSRPFNTDPEVARTRPDVLLIEGGLVQLPPNCPPSVYAGPRPGFVYACAAETMLWALEHAYAKVHPAGCMEVASLLELAAIGRRHGFRVACEGSA